jgi:signal transduction histidine kinase
MELQRASLADLVSDAIEGMRPRPPQSVRLEGSVAPGISPALIAPQKIERVLYNLVTNAVRHPGRRQRNVSVTPTTKPTTDRRSSTDRGIQPVRSFALRRRRGCRHRRGHRAR